MSKPLSYNIRRATVDDCQDILRLIKELAEYEKMSDRVEMTVEVLRRDGFSDPNRPYFHCFVAQTEPDRSIVGYGIYYYTYSTWLGLSSWLEDLYVTPACRGKGIGKALLRAIAKDAVDSGCCRLDFAVLNWNEVSIAFYKRQGAVNLTKHEKWNMFRMDSRAMRRLAGK